MNDKQTILWIHGFAGCPNNATVQEMRKCYPNYDWYSIEVDHHAIASMRKINNFIKTNEVCLVAGTSLGGYYAMCADYDGPKLVVNPVTDPVRDLRQFLGKNQYKPGRPDGQTDFVFTETMLNEFAELKYDKLHNVLCHYTAHDQLLGEDIKKDYEKIFYFLELIDEKILPNHFVSLKYVKRMKQDLDGLVARTRLGFLTLDNYSFFDGIHKYFPVSILPVLFIAHSNNEGINWRKVLHEFEDCIKDVYKKNKKFLSEPWNKNEKTCKKVLEMLFLERKNILMKEFFDYSEKSMQQLSQINNTLLELEEKMKIKMKKVYTGWLENEDAEWRNDCNVSGVIHVNGMKEVSDDDSGSDYEWMLEKIEDIDGNIIMEELFSGSPSVSCESIPTFQEKDIEPSFSIPGFDRNVKICRTFEKLYCHSLYSPQDILRIQYFWCDVDLTHQRIVNDKGDLQ